MDVKRCPECAEEIKRDARVCKHCGYRYSDADLAAQRRADEQAGKSVGIGCLIVILVAGGIYVFGGSNAPEPTTEMIDEPDTQIASEIPDQLSSVVRDPISSNINSENGETIATSLNLNGLLCARVTDVKPLAANKNVFEVTCVEYRGGTGTVRYVLNADTGVAFRP